MATVSVSFPCCEIDKAYRRGKARSGEQRGNSIVHCQSRAVEAGGG